jgi:hypothetical protein
MTTFFQSTLEILAFSLAVSQNGLYAFFMIILEQKAEREKERESGEAFRLARRAV